MGVDAASAPGRRSASIAGRLAGAFDVPLVVVAAIVAIAAGAPAVGASFGAGIWVLQRVVAVVDRRWADRMSDRHNAIKVSLFERFGRIWLLAAGIVVAGVVGGRSSGLTCAVFVFAAYTLGFVNKLFSGPPPARSDR